MPQAAIGVDDEPIGRQNLQSLVDARHDHVGGFDRRILDVDDAQAEAERLRRIFLEQLEILVALARELQDELIDLGVEDGWEEELVMAFPDRPRIAVAVTDVQPRVGPSTPS